MPICSSGISSDLSRSSAAVRAYVPPFLLFPFSSLSPPSLPRFSHFLQPFSPEPAPVFPVSLLCAFPVSSSPAFPASCRPHFFPVSCFSNSLRSPPLLPARTVSSLCSLPACPSVSALLVLLPLFPGFCFFLPLPFSSCLPCTFGFLQRYCQKNAESSSRVICIFVCFRKNCPERGQFLDDLELL